MLSQQQVTKTHTVTPSVHSQEELSREQINFRVIISIPFITYVLLKQRKGGCKVGRESKPLQWAARISGPRGIHGNVTINIWLSEERVGVVVSVVSLTGSRSIQEANP